ncbi:hypothetical protein [Corallococcus sp. AB011P]|uniref:hypothetical protein n=1 Tax=Corallococcus sp. AB011P TaxID=2316735 RepID=UPI001F264D88|nr:hypothetical protein [Corallococcus sp. AB011P]
MRKTAWPGTTKPGEKLYSDEVGSTVSAVIAVTMMAGAVGLYLWLTTDWLFLLPLGMVRPFEDPPQRDQRNRPANDVP